MGRGNRRGPAGKPRLRSDPAQRSHTVWEIDIVVQKNGVTVFVELKTLASSKSFFPEQQITTPKREPMLNSALHHAAENSINQWQIDMVAIEGKPGDTPVIHHFENIQ